MSQSQDSEENDYVEEYVYEDPVHSIPPPHLEHLFNTNATSSPFLRLPTEIRNQISYYALSDEHFSIWDHPVFDGLQAIIEPNLRTLLHSASSISLLHHPTQAIKHHHHLTALPQTCRQLYTETYLLPYSFNIFSFPHVSALDTFATHLGRHLYIQAEAQMRIVPPIKWIDWVLEESNEPFNVVFGGERGLRWIGVPGKEMERRGWAIGVVVERLRELEGKGVEVVDLRVEAKEEK